MEITQKQIERLQKGKQQLCKLLTLLENEEKDKQLRLLFEFYTNREMIYLSRVLRTLAKDSFAISVWLNKKEYCVKVSVFYSAGITICEINELIKEQIELLSEAKYCIGNFLKMSNRKITKENSEKEVMRLAKKGCYRKALDLVRRFKPVGLTTTKKSLKSVYGLTKAQIAKLNFIEVNNPHYICAGPMRLYLKMEIEKKFKKAA